MQDDGILDSLGGSEEGLRQLFSPLSSEQILGSLQAGFVARVVTALIVKRPVPLLDWIQVQCAEPAQGSTKQLLHGRSLPLNSFRDCTPSYSCLGHKRPPNLCFLFLQRQAINASCSCMNQSRLSAVSWATVLGRLPGWTRCMGIVMLSAACGPVHGWEGSAGGK